MTTLRCTCDLCFARAGRYVEAVHARIAISIDGMSGVLDLCESHYDQLLRPVHDALADREQDDSTLRGKRSGPFLCQVDGCKAAPLKHTGTFWQHLRGVHQMTMDEFREKWGDPVPLSKEELANLVVEAGCEVEGCGQVYSTALGNRFPHQALISHMWGRHGIRVGDRAAPNGNAR